MVRACLISVTCPEGELTKAVERVGFHSRIAEVAEHGQGLLEVPGSLLVAAEPQVDIAEPGQALGLAFCMAYVTEQG